MPIGIGVAAAQGLLCLVGWAVLLALRLVDRQPRSLLLATGPAYLVGIATTGPLLILALVAGVPLTAPTVVAISAGVIAACAPAAVRRSTPTRAPADKRRPSHETLAIGGVALQIAGWAVYVATRLPNAPITLDDARNWSLKAYAIFYSGHIEPQIFLGHWHAMHPEYPILQPTLHAAVYSIAGAAGAGQHLTLWLIVLAGVWTIGWLVDRPGTTVIWLVPLVLVVTTPAVVGNIAIGYADVPTAIFVATGALMIGRWIEDHETACLVIGILLLGAAGNFKNEGTAAAVAVVLVGSIVLVWSSPRRPALSRWLLGIGLLVITLLPWRIWILVHHLPNTDQPSFATMFNPAYIADRFQRGRIAADRVLAAAVDDWPRMVPLLIAVTAVAFTARGVRPRLPLYWIGAMLAVGMTVVYAYWTSTEPLSFHLKSADRTSGGMVLLAAAGLAHMLARTSASTSGDD